MDVLSSKVSYKVIAITEKYSSVNITNAIQSLGWEENDGELALKISFELYNAKHNGEYLSSILKIGSWIKVTASYGGTSSTVAYAKIQDAEKVDNGTKPTYKVTAYDCLFDMQKSQDNVYYASGKKTDVILKAIMKSWNVPVSSYAGPKVSHSKIVYKNKSLADIVLGILDEAKKKGGGTGFVRSVGGKVEFVMAGSNKEIFIFNNSNSTTSSYKISTADMVTRVKIVTSSGSSDKTKVDATVNGKTEYGVRQKIITRSKSEKLSDAKKEANEILKEDGKPKETRKLIAPDVPCIRKGDFILIGSNSTPFVVKSIQHNADKQQMTMTIETKPADPTA